MRLLLVLGLLVWGLLLATPSLAAANAAQGTDKPARLSDAALAGITGAQVTIINCDNIYVHDGCVVVVGDEHCNIVAGDRDDHDKDRDRDRDRDRDKQLIARLLCLLIMNIDIDRH